MLFRNLPATGCQGGQGSPRAVAPSEEEEGFYSVELVSSIIVTLDENIFSFHILEN
jgi:hypothetical protein